jgi:hypothetical protein
VASKIWYLAFVILPKEKWFQRLMQYCGTLFKTILALMKMPPPIDTFHVGMFKH